MTAYALKSVLRCNDIIPLRTLGKPIQTESTLMAQLVLKIVRSIYLKITEHVCEVVRQRRR